MKSIPLIARLKELLDKGTKGPWLIDPDHREGGADQLIEGSTIVGLTIAFGTSNGNENDLPLIASLRNSAHALIEVIEAAMAENAAWRENYNGTAHNEFLVKATDAALAKLEEVGNGGPGA